MDHTLTIGRIVLYRLDQGRSKGEYRPAIIVRVWGSSPDSCVQLQVFTDAGNDGLESVHWATSRVHGKEEGQWLWPNEV